jgi:hypothetical protein
MAIGTWTNYTFFEAPSIRTAIRDARCNIDSSKISDEMDRKIKNAAKSELHACVLATHFRAPDLNWKNFSGGPDI